MQAETKEEKIIQFITSERHRQGVSQSALAASAGVSMMTLYSLEAGRNGPTLKTCESLLEALGYELTVRKKSKR